MRPHDILDREHTPSYPSLEQPRKIGSSVLTHTKDYQEAYTARQSTPLSDTLPAEALVSLHGWDLIHPPANANDPTYLLADSLAHLRDPDLSDQQKNEIREIVQHDAEALASQLLSPDKAEELALPPQPFLSEDLQNEVPAPDQENPPALRDVILLVRAFDETGDPKIKGAVKLIFENTPPSASEELHEKL